MFEKIRGHGLKLNKSMWHIAVNELAFLGHIIYLSQLKKEGFKSFLGC